MPLKRIPFDVQVVSAVVAELQDWVGARIQNAWQPDDGSIVLEIYRDGVAYLVLSCDPDFARLYLTTRKGANQSAPTPFLSAVRSRLVDTKIASIEQVDGDRVVDIVAGPVLLRAELMGKHSNLILVDGEGRIIDAAKRIGPAKSHRIILPGKTFEPPPLSPGHSPFAALVGDSSPGSYYAAGFGAYPRSLAHLGYEEIERTSINTALDQHYSAFIPLARLESERASLLGQLRRSLSGKKAALEDLAKAIESGGKAPAWQMMGELTLAFGTQSFGSEVLETSDYEGNPVLVTLDPEKTPVENANAYFAKAKKAKARMPILLQQSETIAGDIVALEGHVYAIENATNAAEIERLSDEARKRKWMGRPNLGAVSKEEKPFEGQRIRSYEAPNGYVVLVGENSEANDYLTVRVGRPDDIWLHVRGAPSAHAIIPTSKKPDKVPPEVIRFAARLVVQHSPSKHSGFVTVDYTLKKHVRRMKGGKLGSVLYSHEKTVDVTG